MNEQISRSKKSCMKSGLKPTRHDHRDYDFFKSKKLGAVVPSFADNYCVDAGLWFPNQEIGSTLFNPNVPPMPYGCTDYAQTELCIDEDKTLYNPWYLEGFTHANQNGGSDLRTSLQAVVDNGMEDQLGHLIKGQHQAYFNIKASGAIDWFDAMRLAMISASTENRAVSVGTPWFPEFWPTLPNGVWNTPTDWTLARASWHNWCVKGWKTIDGIEYLIAKPWLGDTYGDKGFGYVSRPLFNALMNIPGTVAFTLDKLMPGETPQVVDSSIVQWIVSLIRSLFNV